MFGRRLQRAKLLLAAGVLPSLVGCPVVPPASQWGPTDVGCLDHWSLVHFGSGLVLGATLGNSSLWPSMAVLSGWEMVEPTFWPGESGLNQQCDLVVGGAGWFASLGM